MVNLIILESVSNTVGGISNLVSSFGFGVVGVSIIFGLFIYIVWYITTKLTKRFEDVIIELRILQDLIKNENLNSLSSESAKSIIKNQISNSKYELIEEIMNIYTENDLKSPIRQSILGERLYGFIKNLVNRDYDNLSKYKYKDNKLTCYVDSLTAEAITKPLLKMMFERSMSRSDVYKEINTIFNSITNKAKDAVNQVE